MLTTFRIIAYTYFAATYYSHIFPTPGTCAGEEQAAIFGCSLLTSYLFLFINFYVRTYRKSDGKKGGKPVMNKDVGAGVDKVQKVVANGSSNGHTNGSANGVNGHSKSD